MNFPPRTSFQDSRQQTTAQPISLLNPTSYHLQRKEQRELRNKISSDGAPGAPPTPNNSYQSNILSNSFPNNTIDPQFLNRQQLQFINPIKHESASPEIMEEFDQSNTVMSPLTTCGDSPPNHSFGSPTNNSFGSPPNHMYEAAEDFGRSFKPPSHLDSLTFDSPGNTTSLYSPNIDNVEYCTSYDDFSMSAPSATAIEVKANMNNNNTKVNFRHPQHSLNQISMSLPVLTNSGADGWQFGTSLDGHSNSLQFSNAGDMPMINSGFMEADESDSQKAAAAFEKRRRRRESHNAVERRRRDNINEKIQELSTLLPDLFVDSANKPNKGVILRKSVDYIRHLKHVYEQERNRNVRLESQVRELSSKSTIDNNSGSASSRSDLNNSSGGNFGTSMP